MVWCLTDANKKGTSRNFVHSSHCMMEIALFEPEIPPNTGNIIRLAVCTGTRVHIVGQPAFSMEDSMLRRAGLDYWHLAGLQLHENLESFLTFLSERDGRGISEIKSRFVLLTRFASTSFTAHKFREDQILLFGRESSGIPEAVRNEFLDQKNQWLRIPVHGQCRSLNLANSVAVVLYEGLRQQGFPGLEIQYPSDK